MTPLPRNGPMTPPPVAPVASRWIVMQVVRDVEIFHVGPINDDELTRELERLHAHAWQDAGTHDSVTVGDVRAIPCGILVRDAGVEDMWRRFVELRGDAQGVLLAIDALHYTAIANALSAARIQKGSP